MCQISWPKSMISHQIVQQMSLILGRHPSVYILFWAVIFSKKISWHLSHRLKACPSVSQTDSTKIEPPLDVTGEQRQFLSSLTTILVWEWPMQGFVFRRSSKGPVRDGQNNFLTKSTTQHWACSGLRFPCTISRVLSIPCGSKPQESKVWITFSWEGWWDSS